MIWIILGIAGFSVLVLAGWVIGGYNFLTTGKQNIRTQWSNIKTEYQRRADLFYNLVETVKSHKKFEKSTLVEVIKARKGNFGASKTEQADAMKNMDSIFAKLTQGINVVFERYPELKSSEQHNKLMDEIRITEDRINVARTDYNDVVREYNIYVVNFPSNIIAKKFNFAEEEYFKNDEASDKPVKMKLD